MSKLFLRPLQLIALLAISIPSTWAAPDALIESLKPWSPEQVTIENGTITVVTPQDRVTDTIYTAVLMNGVCASLWFNEGAWSGISEIKVLNRHARQGYVFEGGEAECTALGELNSAESKPYILARTHLN